MSEDCCKYLKKAKIGFIETFNPLVIIYTIFAMIFGYIKIEPYNVCLSQYKDKKF